MSLLDPEVSLLTFRVLSLWAAVAWVVVSWTTIRFILQANGQRPIILCLLVFSFIMASMAGGFVVVAFQATQVNHDIAGFLVLYSRVALLIGAGVLYWTGERVMQSKEKH